MIETVIKRNGTEESFQPNKIMNWVMWAERDLGQKNVWWPIVSRVVGELGPVVQSSEITKTLIKYLVEANTWVTQRLAGRLYAIELLKDIYGTKVYPPIKDVQAECISMGLMRDMGYSDKDYAYLDTVINHERDLELPQYALEYLQIKYAIKNRVTKEIFETPQYIYMRMAMAIHEKIADPVERLSKVKAMYEELSSRRLTAPTPNFNNLGTTRKAAVSCVLFSTGDTSDSISAGNHILENCVTAGAGIGSKMMLRSQGDPIRNGEIVHEGLYLYYRAHGSIATMNKQGSRGGAITETFDVFNPEIDLLLHLRNPRTPEGRRNRLMHYAVTHHPFFARKAMRNEDFFVFTAFSAPDLYNALYHENEEVFAELYSKYENDPLFPKTYLNARDVILTHLAEWLHVGTIYYANAHAINHHTPFKDPIYLSNLCHEIVEPTKPYTHTKYLYDPTDHDQGEIATCNLAGHNVSNLPITDENESIYAELAYQSLKMVDSTILNSDYPFPHMNTTARARMNAGVGIHGLAVLLASQGLHPDSKEGLEYVHQVAERHMYHLIKASIRISKERGLAPWIHKTKWVDGWTPMKTYSKAVDEIADFTYRYDWDALSEEIKANGGLAHSTLVAHMPGESSTKPVGTTNCLWSPRELNLIKTDGSSKISWVAPHAEDSAYTYKSAWGIHLFDQVKLVAIVQKFTDQAISNEFFIPLGKAETLSSLFMLEFYSLLMRYGIKTGYYINVNTHTDNVGSTYISAFNRPMFDESTLRELYGDAVLEKVMEACENCDA